MRLMGVLWFLSQKAQATWDRPTGCEGLPRGARWLHAHNSPAGLGPRQ